MLKGLSSAPTSPGCPTSRPRIQRNLERAGIWPDRPSVKTIDLFITEHFLKETISTSKNPARQATPSYLTGQFTARIAYYLWNHWTEFIKLEDSEILPFIEKSQLIPNLQKDLEGRHLPIPKSLQFKLVRLFLLIKLRQGVIRASNP